MGPRNLTDEQKERQRRLIVQKGRTLLLASGMRKVGVDDIARAAGLAKGTFYLYFESKEAFLFVLVKDLHERLLNQLEQKLLQRDARDRKERVRRFIRRLFEMPEFLFFLKNHDELQRLLLAEQHDQVQALQRMEYETYARILKLMGISTKKAKPGVVMNCVHAIFAGVYGNELMIDELIPEAIDVLIDGLVDYIFKGSR